MGRQETLKPSNLAELLDLLLSAISGHTGEDIKG